MLKTMKNTFDGSGFSLQFLSPRYSLPQRGTEYAEIDVPSVENPQLSKVHSLKPGTGGQNIAMQSSPTARNFPLFSTFPVHSTPPPPIVLYDQCVCVCVCVCVSVCVIKYLIFCFSL